ncbi:ABC transporter permease [Cellulomonas bogoriensis]|uniref:ABC transporter permease n=1 Tax=Cellulomonas bogoriensis 69B4 = DSM 16987 TaxID=1386082 RepID=A0A0A0C0Z9_9CELL|nr:ABC transporter permease [Cellulomonas bogoriensis]KGM13632.1 ABC transporter permease [Cellulomonas bogoriensis 69B4 = DSM 16987]
MIAALRSEYRKTVTTRMWWVLLLAMAGYMAFLGGSMAVALAIDPTAGTGAGDPDVAVTIDPVDLARTVYSIAVTFGYVFPAVIGAMAVTGEYRHQTLTPTYLADPRRGRVLVAKMVATLPVGLVFGVAGAVSTVAAGAGALMLLGESPMLGEPEVLRTIGLSVLALGVWALVGVGFGAAMPNQVAAIVVLLAFTQLVEPLARVFLAVFEATAHVAKWLPGAAGEAVTGASFFSATGMHDLLPWWQGLLVLLGYAVALGALGSLTTLRRDVT